MNKNFLKLNLFNSNIIKVINNFKISIISMVTVLETITKFYTTLSMEITVHNKSYHNHSFNNITIMILDNLFH